MGIEVVTPPTRTNLTTLVKVKRELDITDNNNDTLLNDLIAQASQAVTDYTHREFAQATYKETVSANSGNYIQLSVIPVVSITSVLHEGSPIVDYNVDDLELGSLYRAYGWTSGAVLGWGLTNDPNPYIQNLNYTIQYVAGYTLPNPANEDEAYTLPKSVERATIETVKYWWFRRKRDPALASKQVDGLNLAYFASVVVGYGISPTAQELLVPYIQRW